MLVRIQLETAWVLAESLRCDERPSPEFYGFIEQDKLPNRHPPDDRKKEPIPLLAQFLLTQTAAHGEHEMTNLKDFTTTVARPLPVLLLADVSGSMSIDGKIDALNDAVAEMLAAFAEEDDSRAEIHVAVITFGAREAKLHQPLAPASSVTWAPMQAAGNTPMGAAFALATAILEDRSQIPSRAYRPTLILLSDGQPNDEWRPPLQRLLSLDRAAKAARFALGIGDADLQMLQEFLGRPDARVLQAHEARDIKKFFRWVTMTVTSRSRSATPDTFVPAEPTSLDELDF